MISYKDVKSLVTINPLNPSSFIYMTHFYCYKIDYADLFFNEDSYRIWSSELSTISFCNFSFITSFFYFITWQIRVSYFFLFSHLLFCCTSITQLVIFPWRFVCREEALEIVFYLFFKRKSFAIIITIWYFKILVLQIQTSTQ